MDANSDTNEKQRMFLEKVISQLNIAKEVLDNPQNMTSSFPLKLGILLRVCRRVDVAAHFKRRLEQGLPGKK